MLLGHLASQCLWPKGQKYKFHFWPKRPNNASNLIGPILILINDIALAFKDIARMKPNYMLYILFSFVFNELRFRYY